ncbi:elongation factor 1-alpha [Ziziphus jujuba]|uniref:Elongation factor 1-alpha n=1 Tax=Ziziphus jujuba TaxID=326968 RepID=A0A6P4AMU1_ZIZJJ|nr:elongation factor 1-alpha [Ziziphus jujuba]
MTAGNKKVDMNTVVMGQVGAGKSTTTAYLSSKLRVTDIDKNVSKELDKTKKKPFKYDRKLKELMDKLKDKHEHGTSIDKLSKFKTTKFLVIVTEVRGGGGHDYIESMITGISQADCAILIVDSTAGGSTSAPYKLDEQTREHALLAFNLGIKQMICCCNKMDATTPEYSEDRYNEIKESVSSYMKEVGYNPDNIPFIPISSSKGDNLINRSTNLHWYKDPTLIEALNQIREPNQHSNKPLRFSFKGHVKVGMNGTLGVGRIETGILKPGTKVTIGPIGVTTKVKSVGINYESVQRALPGDIVGIHLNKKIDVKCGYVASNSEDDPVKEAISFTSQLFILKCPGGCLNIPEGYIATLHCHTFEGDVKFDKIMGKSNLMSSDNNDQELTHNVDLQCLVKGDVAIVKMVPVETMVVEGFVKYPPLGRFTITDHMKRIVGVGVITGVERKKYRDGDNKKSVFIKGLKWLANTLGHVLLEILIGCAVDQVFDCLERSSKTEEDANQDTNKDNEGQNSS